MAIDNEAWRLGIQVGDEICGRVIKHEPFGFFVLINDKIDGIVERVQMERDGYDTPAEYPPVGADIKGVVLGFRQWSHQIDVGLCPKIKSKG